jgi:GT2 family glycosyltransferase
MRFPATDAPLVSVVMVTHGAWHWTRVALTALAQRTSTPFEVIVVDNASPDDTPARLGEIEGAHVLLNERNEGFGPACNYGAEHARGHYVLFLNSDAIVNEGWLEPLLEVFDADRDAAIAVPRFLHLDGSLQEAGALIAQDGTVATYGDRESPDDLPYRFARVIDFGGAACMLTSHDGFEAVGGFDDTYASAYYEEADLCMKLAARGLRTYYAPRSVVTHARYGSPSLEHTVVLSERSRQRFVARWGASLRARPRTLRGGGERSLIAARDATTSGRVLVVDDGWPAADGGPALATVGRLADRRPALRVTWVTGAVATGALDPDPWLARGVELTDTSDPDWLRHRPYTYDAVVVGALSDVRLADAILATQPQASRLALAAVDREDALWRALSDAGIA